MINTPTVAKLIEEGRTSQIYSAMNEGGYWGMQTMNQSLMKYWRAGVDQRGGRHDLRRQLHRAAPDAPPRARPPSPPHPPCLFGGMRDTHREQFRGVLPPLPQGPASPRALRGQCEQFVAQASACDRVPVMLLPTPPPPVLFGAMRAVRGAGFSLRPRPRHAVTYPASPRALRGDASSSWRRLERLATRRGELCEGSAAESPSCCYLPASPRAVRGNTRSTPGCHPDLSRVAAGR